MENKEILLLLNSYIHNYNIYSYKMAEVYTLVYYKNEYMSGNESADFIDMINNNAADNFDFQLIYYYYYMGQCAAFESCIANIAVSYGIKIERKKIESEFTYQYKGKEYKLPIKYYECSIEED